MVEYIRYNITEIATYVAILVFVIKSIFYIKDKKSRQKLGFYINYLSYKLGITKNISTRYISKIHVKDCNEPLVELVKHPKIFYNDSSVEHPVLLRKEVTRKLYKVADSLPDDVYLKIYSAFRSRIAVYNAWHEEEERLTRENPNMNRAELLELVNSKVSSPKMNMGGHDTGAAIDLALCDANQQDFDFGTKVKEKHKNTHLTNEQKNNRKMLKGFMKAHNFVNLPGQWWHFSYGDKIWAAYKGKRNGAFYGAAEKEFENIGYVSVVKTEIKSVNIK